MATVNIFNREWYLDIVGVKEQSMRKLAREMAIGLVPYEQIFEAYGIGLKEWEELSRNRNFLDLLKEEMQAWGAAKNTRERIELKTWAMIEDALPHFYEYLLSPSFADAAKVSLYTALQKQVGIGLKEAAVGDPGQRVFINISTGNSTVQIEPAPPEVTPEVIEGQAVELIEQRPKSPWRG